jgi:hypothetical protein
MSKLADRAFSRDTVIFVIHKGKRENFVAVSTSVKLLSLPVDVYDGEQVIKNDVRECTH